MRIFMDGILWFVIALTISSCSGKRAEHDQILLPVLDSSGHETLQTLHLMTLYSPYEVDGSVARVMVDPRYNNGVLNGSPAQPKYAKSAGTLIPTDTAGGTALALYSIFENIYFFEQRVLIENDIHWPRMIGLYTNRENSAVHSAAENDAYYNPATDNYTFLPFTDKGKTAYALNPGVSAHEHFHAHFQNLVGRLIPEVTFRSDGFVANGMVIPIYSCPRYEIEYSQILNRSWTEGLADFYASLFSGRRAFLSKSASAASTAMRELESHPTKILTRVEMTDQINSNRKSLLESGILENCVAINPYRVGTQIARVLSGMAARNEFPPINEGTQRFSSNERAARFLLDRIRRFGPELKAQVIPTKDPSTINTLQDLLHIGARGFPNVNPEFLLQSVLRDVPLSSTTCGDLSLLIGSDSKSVIGSDSKSEFPQCASPLL
jgi:hypothetical protein